jgi:hypothetical protein
MHAVQGMCIEAMPTWLEKRIVAGIMKGEQQRERLEK